MFSEKITPAELSRSWPGAIRRQAIRLRPFPGPISLAAPFQVQLSDKFWRQRNAKELIVLFNMQERLSRQDQQRSAGCEVRQEFLCQSFSSLHPIEQCLILAELQRLQRGQEGCLSRSFTERPGVNLIQALELYRQNSPDARAAIFAEFTNLPQTNHEIMVEMVVTPSKNYFPALLALLRAAYQGEDAGVLTARGNRRGHDPMIEAIESFLGISFRRHNIYFVNDETRNKRLGDVSTAEKKLRILLDFAAGFYRDENGDLQNLSRRYEKVYFYDDERKNLNTVTAYAEANGLADRIIAVDAKELSLENLWRDLQQMVAAGLTPDIGRKAIMHFFDIDGTLLQVDAKMYVVETASRERLMVITQEQLADNPSAAFWLQAAHQLRPDIPLEKMEMDFGDFKDAERLKQQLKTASSGRVLFKE